VPRGWRTEQRPIRVLFLNRSGGNSLRYVRPGIRATIGRQAKGRLGFAFSNVFLALCRHNFALNGPRLTNSQTRPWISSILLSRWATPSHAATGSLDNGFLPEKQLGLIGVLT
jgi:hypothetical protein